MADIVKQKVLITEDEAPLLKGLSEKFALEGFQVFTARDGSEGLAAALKEHPDMIILDLLMPKMDGLTMLRELRVDSWGKHVPVVVWSNSRDLAREREAKNLGVLEFWVKSDLRFKEVVRRVKERLGGHA